MTRKILVTAALPYASGEIHLGNLLEMVQTDIWVRYQRLSGADCAFVCATDAHGTPTMLKAREESVSPEEYAESCRAAHVRDFEAFGIRFDNYYTTHSPENRELVERIYSRLVERGFIRTRTIQQAYDEEAGMFLPDRYVRGECPSCGAQDQYGDSCAACGATYAPSELVNPRSILSGRPPVTRESEHKFFRLGEFESLLKTWMQASNLDRGARNKLAEWFNEGLKDWDITRDEPYFGFEVPGEKGKYFYVWLDAPVGYMASFRNLCGAGEEGEDRFERYFGADSDAELYHFIGKDILYFHALFWPAVLLGAGMRTPSGVFVHGFLTVDGQKMSKSRGTFITGADYLAAGLDPEYLRYYYAAKLGPGLDDIDLQLEDFAARINSDLVGKLVNIASRCASFVQRGFGGELGPSLNDPALYEEFAAGERADRRVLRVALVRQGHAFDHGPGGPRQRLDQRAQALGTGQGCRQARRAACRRDPGHQPVQGADDVCRPGAAPDVRARRGLSRREACLAGRRQTVARRRYREIQTACRPRGAEDAQVPGGRRPRTDGGQCQELGTCGN